MRYFTLRVQQQSKSYFSVLPAYFAANLHFGKARFMNILMYSYSRFSYIQYEQLT